MTTVMGMLAAFAGPHWAAAQSRAGGAVIGTGAVTGFVEDMDRSLAFYHDVFGMEVPALPEAGARPCNATNAQLFDMFDIRGAKERHQFARVPNGDVRFELMEVQNVEHSTVALRIQDPGAMTLVFVVTDAAPFVERARRANAEIVTPGGRVVERADGSRSVLLRDLDGRFMELRESAPAGAKGDDAALRLLTGLSTAEVRRSAVRGPGSSLVIEFVEYAGVDRKPLAMRIQDRGAARLQLRAENLEVLVARLRAAGLHVVSKGGGPVPIPPNLMGALVADPNNFFLTPFAPCDGWAPRLLPETR